MLVVGAAVVATLVPAAPVVTVTASPVAPSPRPQVLPGVPDRRDVGCTVPIGPTLLPCAPDDRLRPPVSCVLPVDLPPGTTRVTPGCPPRDPSPEGSIVPLVRLTR
jgi:hypothetical protein